MHDKNEAERRVGRPRVLLSIPIVFLFLVAVAGWLLALLRRQSSRWLEIAVLAVALLAVGYLTVLQYALRRPQRSRAARGESGAAQSASPRFLDALTGLPSRSWLEQTLTVELARNRRYHRHLCLVVLDIDHFTRMNRDHGEVAGDWVLESVGSLLRSSVRESDHVARIGDDAFVLVLAETPEAGALRLAEKLRAAVAALSTAPAGKAIPGVPVSVSIGVAAAKESDSAEVFLRRAEAAAMTARRGGGDRVATATF